MNDGDVEGGVERESDGVGIMRVMVIKRHRDHCSAV